MTGTWQEARRRFWALVRARGMSLGLPSIGLASQAGPGGPRREAPSELKIRDVDRSADQNLALLEQNKKEPVAVQSPGTTAINPSIC